MKSFYLCDTPDTEVIYKTKMSNLPCPAQRCRQCSICQMVPGLLPARPSLYCWPVGHLQTPAEDINIKIFLFILFVYNLNLRLCPPVVDVDDGKHVPFSGLELILYTMLVSFAFYLK